MPFYCLKTPEFKLSIADGTLIETSTCFVSATYSQANGEQLNYVKFSLYSNTETLIQSSDEIYDIDDLSYVFTSLENATPYSIRATGETVNRIPLDTGYIHITASYKQAEIFSITEANNLPKIGAIELKNNIVTADAVSDVSASDYIAGGGVNLISKYAEYKSGFVLKNDFTMLFRVKDFILNEPIITFKDSNGFECEIYPRYGQFEGMESAKYYFELVAKNDKYSAISMSNYCDTKSVNLWIFRELCMYRIKIKEGA